MAYLNCGRCGLQIKIQADYLRIDNCPRCLAHSGTIAPMTLSANGVRHAVGWGPRAPDQRGEPREPGEPLVPVEAAAKDMTASRRFPTTPRVVGERVPAHDDAAVTVAAPTDSVPTRAAPSRHRTIARQTPAQAVAGLDSDRELPCT